MAPDGEQPRAEAPAPPRWGLADVAGGFLVGLLLSSVLASIWIGATGDDDLDLAGQGLAQIGFWAGLVGSVVFASRRKGAGRLDVDFGFRARPVDLAVGVVAGLLAHRVLLYIVALVMRPLVGEPDVSGPSEDLFDSAHGVEIVFVVLFVVVGAAVVEELFFRGLLLRALERRVGTSAAVGLSAAFFGFTHLLQPLPFRGLVLVWVSLAALGVVLALLVVRTGRLGPSIVAHAAFNGLTAWLILAG